MRLCLLWIFWSNLHLTECPPPPGSSSSPDSQHRVSLGSLLDDQHWHHIAVERHSAHLNLTVDKSTLLVEIPPTFTYWDHDQVCWCGHYTGRKNSHSSSATDFFFLFKFVCAFHMFFSAQMSVGVEHDLDSQRLAGSRTNFHGCLENLVYNGMNLVDLAKQRDQRVTAKVNWFRACALVEWGWLFVSSLL